MKLFHQGKARYINYGLSYKPVHWNDEENMIASSFKNSGREKAMIMKKLSGASVLIAENEDNIDSLSIDDLKELIVEKVFLKKKKKAADSKKRVLFLFEYTNEIIDWLKKTKKVGNAATYQNCLSSLKNYLKDKDIAIEKIDHTFLVEYETGCLNKGMNFIDVAYLKRENIQLNRLVYRREKTKGR